jgi:uncharacterized membrane protein YeaQ/YmgE (transglycosylase-associated protein family)
MINFIAWIAVGGLLGWLVSLMIRTDSERGVLLNIIVGIVGALIAGWVISPMIGVGRVSQGSFSGSALLISLFGALVLLSVINVLKREAAN